MNKEQFVSKFVVMFLATHAANIREFCITHNREIDFPVEDAEYLALQAWDEVLDKTELAILEDE